MTDNNTRIAKFHLPGLFEFYDFYREFLTLFYNHGEYFYEWVKIDSIYGAPSECVWGGGRVGTGDAKPNEVLELLSRYEIGAELTFSNSLLEEEHLNDEKCNALCALFDQGKRNGAVVFSEILLEHLKTKYPNLYLTSSTTKVLTDFEDFKRELEREDFRFAVADFRLNKAFEKLYSLPQNLKDKTEFLVNECCFFGCKDRRECYEFVSRRILDENCPDFVCKSPGATEGYKFSKAMQNPAFISVDDIQNKYLSNGFSHFKIEGRELGSAVLLEFILHYMVKPQYALNVREELYLDSMLNLL